MITINPQAADVITININDADQIQLNTSSIVLLEDAATLDGEDGAYYLSRGNHTGTQAISTVTGLQDALNLKLDAADYNDRFLGLFASVFDLEAAHPAASAGDYAQVDWGIGVGVIVYAWDVSDTKWSAVGSSAIANTDALPEGSSNLYHTSQRVRDTPLTGLSTASATPITAADSVLSAAGKLQAQISATAAKADAALAAIDAFNPANLSDAGTLLPNDQLVIWRDGVMLRTTVAAFGGGSEPTPTQLMLIPTGAVESADGEFQRFVPNATDPLGYPAYIAELDYADYHDSPISVQFKWPDLTVVDNALVIFFSGGNYNSIENPVGDETDSIYALLQLARIYGGGQGEPYNTADFDFYKFGVKPPTSEPVTLTPSAGDIATLTFTRTQMTLTVGGETQAYAIPAGIFTGVSLLNVIAKVESAVLPLSIKVLHTE